MRHRMARLLAVAGVAGSAIFFVPSGHAIGVFEDVNIGITVNADYTATTLVHSAADAEEIFTITFVRVGVLPSVGTQTDDFDAEITEPGTASLPAVFVVTAQGEGLPVFDRFQAVAVCVTSTSCTVSPSVGIGGPIA